MSELLQVFKKQPTLKTPIWIMRQAGRYLPEYMEIRKSTHNFLDLCYDSSKVVEITLQPIRRFGFDAAIIFSDILLLPHALGWNVRFEENTGPILRQFESEDDFQYLENDITEKLKKVYTAINNTRAKLPSNIPLIGFAGSPWTVSSYMLRGLEKHDFISSKKFIYQNKALAKKLIDFITEKTILHLISQIKAGANLIQLFDSWAGMLGVEEYQDFVIEPTKKIVSKIKEQFPHLPIIGFPRGSSFLYEEYINNTGVDAIGADQFVPLSYMEKWQKKIIVQGNLDPIILLTNKDIIAKKTDDILSKLTGQNFIFNLGHGILPNTPIENVEFLVNYVREFRKH